LVFNGFIVPLSHPSILFLYLKSPWHLLEQNL
jgi:hypothetical protein